MDEEKRQRDIDSLFGFRNEENEWKIEDEQVLLNPDDSMLIDGENYSGTPEFWSLVTRKVPKNYTNDDLDRYKEFLYETHALHQDYDIYIVDDQEQTDQRNGPTSRAQDFTSKIEVKCRANEVKICTYEVKSCAYEVKISAYEVKIRAYEVKYWAQKSIFTSNFEVKSLAQDHGSKTFPQKSR